jgi:hypothetical protein
MSLRSIFASITLASTTAMAQMPPEAPRRIDYAELLNIDTERAGQVEAIMKATHLRMREARAQIGKPTDDTTRSTMHAAMRAIREDADKQLATVLTPDELQKLRAAMPAPPRAFERRRAEPVGSGG